MMEGWEGAFGGTSFIAYKCFVSCMGGWMFWCSGRPKIKKRKEERDTHTLVWEKPFNFFLSRCTAIDATSPVHAAPLTP